jgi:hypothetical protein
MGKTPENVPPTDPGAFAAPVNALYRRAIKGKFEPFQGNKSSEVRRAALGLALLRQLLDQHTKSLSLSAGMPASGIREAYGILDHLTTGKQHPISKHIHGIHSGQFRPQHVPVNAIEQEARKIVVAVVRAYARAAGVTPHYARQVVVEAAEKIGCKFTNDQIKKWDDRFRKPDGVDDAHASPDVGPDCWAEKLSEAGEAQKVLAVGVTWIWKWWAVPETPRG